MARLLVSFSLVAILVPAWRLWRSLDRMSAVQREGAAEVSRSLDRRAELVREWSDRQREVADREAALLTRIDELAKKASEE